MKEKILMAYCFVVFCFIPCMLAFAAISFGVSNSLALFAFVVLIEFIFVLYTPKIIDKLEINL